MRERKMIYVLILIMITACSVVSGIAIYVLYETSFEQQQERLVATAQSQARLIEAVARFDDLHQKKYRHHYEDPADATLSQIIDAHKHYAGFGKTGEFTLARRDGDNIVFLLRHRHSSLEKQKQIRFDSNLAKPMRLALSGKSGTIIGLDYRGMTVVAAYEPVAHLNLGIVTKIDLSEVRAPFVRAGIITGVLSVLAVVVSVLLFLRLSSPIIKTLEKRTFELEKINEALSRLALIVESSDDAIIAKTIDGVIVSWNKGAEKIYGYTEMEVKGKSISILLPPNQPDDISEILKKIERREPIDHYETIRQRKDGTIIDVSLKISGIKNKQGEIVGSSTIARDITDHKRAERELQESEQRFRTLVENSPMGISIIQNNRIVYQNPEQEKLLGPLPREPKFFDTENVHPDDSEKLRQFHQDVISGKVQTQDTDFRFYHTDSANNRTVIKWVQCRASIIEYQGEEAMLVNIMDISRSKDLEKLLRIQDKMSSLGRVAAGIAHEIRNPLSGINIYLNTLEKIYDEGESLEKVEDILGKIQSASIKIESVIRRVMDFSKPSEPKFVLTDINKPIKDALNLSEVTLRKRGIEIEKALALDLPLCQVDPNLIEQVILNLINNATEAMLDMKQGKKIEITSSIGKNCILITVSDSGPGVPLAMRDQLFDPFYSTKSTGTGIGLSISNRIITDHGASLDISESKWDGAEFRIELPIKKGIGDS
jgi:PAS domain S-box-containing protein